MEVKNKIIQLQAENFKRLKAIEINANGGTVVLSGQNAKEKDLQLWVEVVDKDDIATVVIEDGEVK